MAKKSTKKKPARRKKVPQPEPEFVILEKDKAWGTIAVAVPCEPNDKYPQEIGTIQQYSSREERGLPSWKIHSLGPSYNCSFDIEAFNRCYYPDKDSDKGTLIYFHDKESAAAALYALWKTVQSNPCPPEILYYLQDEGRNLYEEERQLLTAFSKVRRKRRDLAALAKKHNVDLNLQPESTTESVEKLVEFFKEHLDSIYDCMGKDWARTFRALLGNVVEEIDPNASLDFGF